MGVVDVDNELRSATACGGGGVGRGTKAEHWPACTTNARHKGFGRGGGVILPAYCRHRIVSVELYGDHVLLYHAKCRLSFVQHTRTCNRRQLPTSALSLLQYPTGLCLAASFESPTKSALGTCSQSCRAVHLLYCTIHQVHTVSFIDRFSEQARFCVWLLCCPGWRMEHMPTSFPLGDGGPRSHTSTSYVHSATVFVVRRSDCCICCCCF